MAGAVILAAVAVVVVWQRPWTSDEPLIGFQGDWKDVMIEQEARVPYTGDWKDLVIEQGQ